MSAGPQKKALRQQFRGVKRQIKATPDAATLERQEYLAGSQPGAYDIRMGGPDTRGGMGGGMSAADASSLGSVNDLLQSLSQGQQQPNYSSIYQGAGGY